MFEDGQKDDRFKLTQWKTKVSVNTGLDKQNFSA